MKKARIVLSLLLSVMLTVSVLPVTMFNVLAQTDALLSKGKVPGSTFYQTSAGNNPASNALDGDFVTKWSTYNCDPVTEDNPAAMYVDLGGNATVNKLGFSWYGSNRYFTYDVYLTNEPIVNGAVVNTADCTPIQSGVGKGTATQASVCEYITLDVPATGRYATVVVTEVSGATFVVLAEFEIWGTASVERGEPLLFDCEATASFSQNGNPAVNAIDGDVATRWSSFGGTLPAALMIDTKGSVSISALEILMFQNGRTYDLEFYLSHDVTVSSDGSIDLTSATMIGSGTFTGVGHGSQTPSSDAVFEMLATDASVFGRYLTVYCTKASSGTASIIWEIQAYGEKMEQVDMPNAPENDPIEKGVPLFTGCDVYANFSQSGYNPENAIDDDITSRWSSYGGTFPAVLMIDTYKFFNVEYVDVLMFQNGRTYDLDFYVSEAPTISENGTVDMTSAVKIGSETVEGTGHGAENPSDDSATVRIETDTDGYGRYFTLYCEKASGGSAAVLWEIEAYGNVYSVYSRSIENIEWIAPVSVPFGTTDITSYLPNEIEVLVDGAQLISKAVTWNTNEFDGNRVGSTILQGEFVDEFANPNQLIPEITVTVRSAEEDTAVRQQFTINDDWLYYKGELNNGQAVDLNTSDFTAVSLPHTFNKYDGQDGGGPATTGNYYKGINWYRKTLRVDDRYSGKNVTLYFEGVSRTCEVYVNGKLAGGHDGSFTAFEMDITSLLHEGENVIAVMVNNINDGTTSPISGDFTVFSGIYRNVSIRLTQAVYVGKDETSDFGMKLTPYEISEKSAKLGVAATVNNTSNTAKSVSAKVTLRNPSSGDVVWIDELPDHYLRFNKADMTPGGTVDTQTMTFSVPANGSYKLTHDFMIANPHLWNGLADPYRYIVDIELLIDGAVVDSVSDFVGIREYTADREMGGFLNGNPYNLRGVARHQDRENMGWALTEKEHNEDIALIYMMGANAIRLAHYPQSDYTYELCDQYGLCVWAEISLVNEIGGDGTYEDPDATRVEFFTNVRQELKEMVLQQYNHASIVVWGLQNECHGLDLIYQDFMNGLNVLAHELDTTRMTTMASNNGSSSYWQSDVLAFNLYPGWYSETANDMDAMVSRTRDGDSFKRPFGISEYGLGCNPLHHSEDETIVCSQSTSLQTHEYQCYGHELIYTDIEEMDYLWCAFIWAMYDFASDWRHEGQTNGTNTKGLVSRDHQTPKDSFYFYQANWSDVPMVHLNAKDFTQRENTEVTVKSYSNCDSVTLYVNGKMISTLKQEELGQDCVFKWKNVVLSAGENTIKVVAEKDGKEYIDETVWNRIISDSIDIITDTVYYSFSESTIWMTHPMTVASVLQEVTSEQRAVLTVLDANENPISDPLTVIQEGMILNITSESGKKNKKLTFRHPNIAVGKPVTVSSSEVKQDVIGDYLTDGDKTTRWMANLTGGVSFPESFIVDLKNVYNLEKINLHWFVNGDRTYYFKLYAGIEENGNWQLLVDGSKNNTVGTLGYDFENAKGRYIYVEVLGNNHYDIGKGSPAASCYEIQVYGWRITPSIRAAVNEKNITFKTPDETVPVSDLDRYITIEGNCVYELQTKSDGIIASGDSLVITHNGKMKRYTISFEKVDVPISDPQVEAIINGINALPNADDITVADYIAIMELSAQYDVLTAGQKKDITETAVSKLENVIAAMDQIIEDTIGATIHAINGLPDADKITLDDKEAVLSANALYISLPSKFLNQITNADKLLAVNKAWESLVNSIITYGDINADNTINAVDALLVLQNAVGKLTFNNEQLKAADVDVSGKIDAVDALLILQKAVGKIKQFPAQQ